MSSIVEFTEEEFPNTGGFPDGFVCPACSATDDKLTEERCTEEEIKSKFNCGRSYACCCLAFTCTVCGVRIRARRAAPEADWAYYDNYGEDDE